MATDPDFIVWRALLCVRVLRCRALSWAAVRKRVKELLKKLAQGDMPLSQLEKELHTFPLLERQFSFLIRTKRDDNFGWYILNEVRHSCSMFVPLASTALT